MIFFTVEYLGTDCNPRCGGCRCGKYAVGNGNYTIKEDRELVHIEEGLLYDANKKAWSAYGAVAYTR